MRLALVLLLVACGCGAKKEATPDTLATGDGNFLRLAVDASGVYWTVAGTTGQGKIMHVGSAVGSKATELVTKLDDPLAIALDPQNIYFTNQRTTGGSVYRVNRTGGMPMLLVGSQRLLTSLVVVGETAYFTDRQAGTIESVPTAGGAAEILATGQLAPDGLAADTLNLFWANTGGNTIGKIDDKVSKTAGDLVTGVAGPGKVAVEQKSDVVYWTSLGTMAGADGAVMKTSATNGMPSPVASELNVGAQGAIAVDDAGVYWIDFEGSDYTVEHALLTGGKADPLVTGTAVTVFDLVVYGDSVYWLESDGQKSYVKKIKK